MVISIRNHSSIRWKQLQALILAENFFLSSVHVLGWNIFYSRKMRVREMPDRLAVSKTVRVAWKINNLFVFIFKDLNRDTYRLKLAPKIISWSKSLISASGRGWRERRLQILSCICGQLLGIPSLIPCRLNHLGIFLFPAKLNVPKIPPEIRDEDIKIFRPSLWSLCYQKY